MAPEIKYHTAARRIIAAIIDGLVLLPLGLTGDLFRKGVFHIDIVSYDLWDLLFGFTGIIYSIFFHYYYGRTVGKALVGLKVLDVTESRRLTLFESFKRDLMSIIVQVFLLAYYFFEQQQMREGNFNFNLGMNSSDFIEYSYIIWVIIELITMLTNQKRRAVHDYLANSVVVVYN